MSGDPSNISDDIVEICASCRSLCSPGIVEASEEVKKSHSIFELDKVSEHTKIAHDKSRVSGSGDNSTTDPGSANCLNHHMGAAPRGHVEGLGAMASLGGRHDNSSGEPGSFVFVTGPVADANVSRDATNEATNAERLTRTVSIKGRSEKLLAVSP